jgi:NitT/TauT family transport system substrate-binding protein
MTGLRAGIVGVAAAVALSLAAGGCGNDDGGSASGGGNAATGEITVAVSAKNSVTYVAIQEGNKLGVWDGSGISVKLVDATSASATQALASGDADIMVNVGTAGVLAQAKGLDLRLVGSILLPNSQSLVVPGQSPVQDVNQLRGKKFGISSFGSGGHYATAMIADHYGWSKNDYQPVVLGDISQIKAAFTRGDIDAFVWSPEVTYEMEASGEGRILATAQDFVPPYVHAGFFATNDMVTNRAAALKTFLDKYYAYIAKLQTDLAPAISIMSDQWKMQPQVADEIAKKFIPELSKSAEIPSENLQNLKSAVEFIEPTAKVDAEKIYQNGQQD